MYKVIELNEGDGVRERVQCMDLCERRVVLENDGCNVSLSDRDVVE